MTVIQTLMVQQFRFWNFCFCSSPGKGREEAKGKGRSKREGKMQERVGNWRRWEKEGKARGKREKGSIKTYYTQQITISITKCIILTTNTFSWREASSSQHHQGHLNPSNLNRDLDPGDLDPDLDQGDLDPDLGDLDLSQGEGGEAGTGPTYNNFETFLVVTHNNNFFVLDR